MTDLFDKNELKEKFFRIAEKKTALSGIIESQVLGSVATHQSMAAEYANHSTERALQESFLATAINRSSVLAAAYDRNYIPRKPIPSNGTARIENKNDYPISIPQGAAFLSEDQFRYETDSPVEVAAKTHSLVKINQLDRESITFFIDNEKPFYDYLLSQELSIQASEIKVFVNNEEWVRTKLFRNTSANSKVWREFYTPLDEIGIQFGNGIFGKIPDIDSEVRIEVVKTAGDLILIQGQSLSPADDSLSLDGVSVSTGVVISGGSNMESIEEIRGNTLHYFMYDESRVWSDDYAFYVRQVFPSVLFIEFWGEQKQEEMDGIRKEENINAIFFSVYSEENPNIAEDIILELNELPEFNRHFKHKKYEDKKFSLLIEGKIRRNVRIDTARDAIEDLLKLNYGKSSAKRKNKAMRKDLYMLMNRSGIFASMDDIYIEISGNPEKEKIYDLVSIDMDSTQIRIGY